MKSEGGLPHGGVRYPQRLCSATTTTTNHSNSNSTPQQQQQQIHTFRQSRDSLIFKWRREWGAVAYTCITTVTNHPHTYKNAKWEKANYIV